MRASLAAPRAGSRSRDTPSTLGASLGVAMSDGGTLEALGRLEGALAAAGDAVRFDDRLLRAHLLGLTGKPADAEAFTRALHETDPRPG